MNNIVIIVDLTMTSTNATSSMGRRPTNSHVINMAAITQTAFLVNG
jgi:hypothetical protein